MSEKNEKKIDYDYVRLVYGVDIEPKKQKVLVPVEPEPEKDNSQMGLYDWLQCIVAAILFGILLFVFVGRIIGVDGKSMVPTLHNYDKVIMSNLFYEPKYGDIVVLKVDDPIFSDKPLVKRIIAVGGQTIDIDFDTGDVIVDGYVLEEPYIKDLTHDREDFKGPITIPQGYVFVMGDNRNASSDSRNSHVGLVDTRQILGKVYWIILPGADRKNGEPREWNRIGSVYN